MDAAMKVKWLEALRSGQYKQAEGQLRKDGGHCCLGVLCEISEAGKWEGESTYIVPAEHSWDAQAQSELPRVLRDQLDISGDAEIRLIHMNDGLEGATQTDFAGIADYIEANL